MAGGRESRLYDKMLGVFRDALTRRARNPRYDPPMKISRKPPCRKRGGSEAVLVEPDQPKLGSGGAEAPLEFDDRDQARKWRPALAAGRLQRVR